MSSKLHEAMPAPIFPPDVMESLTKNNVMGVFPQQIRDLIHEAKLGFLAMEVEFNDGCDFPNAEKIQMDEIEFVTQYHRPDKVNRKGALSEEKKALVAKVTSHMISSLPFHFHYCWNNIDIELSLKKASKHRKQKKRKKRGGRRKLMAAQKDNAESSKILLQMNEEERDIMDDLIAYAFKSQEEKEARMSDYSDDEPTSDTECSVTTVDSTATKENSDKLKAEESSDKLSVRQSLAADGKIIGHRLKGMLNAASATDNKELQQKIVWRKLKTRNIVQHYEKLENAIIDLVGLPFFSSRDNCMGELANIVENLVQPMKYSEKSYKELKGLVDMLSTPLIGEEKPEPNKIDERVRKEMMESGDFTLPSTNDQEGFAQVFVHNLKTCTFSNSQFLFAMGTIIAEEYDGNLLKQKVVEIGMPHLMQVLKRCVLSHQLYVTELIFKVVMAMPCARKYCWRDKDYFPALAKLLTVLDPNPDLDKYQIRGDAVHILYTSVIAAPKEIYEQVAATRSFEYLMTVLNDNPKDERDAQTGEDVIMCVTLFSDHWDLFGSQMRQFKVRKYVSKWRKYALQYASYFPNFVWSLESLLLRLTVLFQYDKVKESHPHFRMETPQAIINAKNFIRTNNRTACSNPECLKLNDCDSEDKYKKCAKCHLAYYCTKECQVKHWSTHKQWCTRPTFLPKKEKLQPVERKLANNKPQEIVEQENGVQEQETI